MKNLPRRLLNSYLHKLNLSNFEKKVLKVIMEIPFGETRSYKWVAEKAGYPSAYRAVGNVLRKNPYPVLIPCHRVVKSNNDLGGYALGKEMKKYLIDLEKAMKSVIII